MKDTQGEENSMDKKIILDGRDFLIVDKINMNNKTYLYVVAFDDTNDFSVLEEYEENGTTYVESVSDMNTVKEVFSIIAEKM